MKKPMKKAIAKRIKNTIMHRIFLFMTVVFLLAFMHGSFIVCNAQEQQEEQMTPENIKSEYATTTYGILDGLSSIEINAIVQTPDGYIWVGSYAGLYRFDGTKFSLFNIDDRINTVTALFTDSRGRLWIGTNDCGVACYDSKTGEVKMYTTNEGLASDSVRAIAQDSSNNTYIATTGQMSVIDADGDISSPQGMTDITYVKQLVVNKYGSIAGVTNNGELFFIKSKKVTKTVSNTDKGIYYTSVCEGKDNKFYVGTSSDKLMTIVPEEDKNSYRELEDVTDIKGIYYDEEADLTFICAGNGFGYLKPNGVYEDLSLDNFNDGIINAIRDYQGNYWFISEKEGVLKMSPGIFDDIFQKAGINERVVNAVEKVGNDLYIGCDDGLCIIDKTSNNAKNYDWMEMFDNVRVRHIMKDSKGRVWFSTYGDKGLVCKNKDDITYFTEADGTMGGRFRLTIELNDGTILAASSEGLTYIDDDKVVATIGEEEGLLTTQMLCVVQLADGTIYAGSDGDGIYIIKDKKIVGKIDKQNGLESLVVMKIIPSDKGFIYVTSNALYYDNHGTITKLTKFPYSNNYDVIISKKNQAWIYGSSGIYVANVKQLIENYEYNCTWLNNTSGLQTTLTANSWPYVDDDDNCYLCCSTGVIKISISDYNKYDTDYNIRLNEISADGVILKAEKDGSYNIPASATRISISPAILDYSMSDPLVHMYIEGFDDNGIVVNQSKVDEITFTNLPHGDYNFRIDILDETTMGVRKSYSVFLRKEAQFYEKTIFKMYFYFVLGSIVATITWMFAKYTSLIVIKKQYNEIEIAKNEAEKANRAKSQFLANVSHEIRTPINTIMGMDELILRKDIDDEVYEYASDIDAASRSLLAIVDDILDLSKIESGKMNIVNNNYETVPMLFEIIDMLEVKAKEKNLKAIMDVDSNIPVKLYGDSGRIKQIILNLLSNAIKYTEKGSVKLTIKLTGNENSPISVGDKVKLYVEVKDTGIGIKDEDKNKIFNDFERVDEKRNSNIKGTGLGLNISKRLLSLMGSELKFESEYEKGSCFFFELTQVAVDTKPIAAAKQPATNKHEYKAGIKAPWASILVIDDTEMNLKVISGLLKETKINVETGASGYDCLEMIQKKHYDIILLDHMMPEMDGVETLKKIKDDACSHLCKDTPVIVLTANAIVGAKEEYIKTGFDDYLSKPVKGTELEEMIRKYLPEKPENINKGSKKDKNNINSNIDNNMIGNNESGDKKRTEKKDYAAIVNAIDFLDTENAMQYCCESEEFYYDILKTFYENNHIKALEEYYKNNNWNDYQVKVHAIKSTSISIGTSKLSEMAKALEVAAKEENTDFIKQNHPAFIKTYRDILEKIKAIL